MAEPTPEERIARQRERRLAEAKRKELQILRKKISEERAAAENQALRDKVAAYSKIREEKIASEKEKRVAEAKERNSEATPKEGFFERHNREMFEGAVLHAKGIGLLSDRKVPAKETFGPEPGIFKDSYLLRDANGELICKVSISDITRANSVQSERDQLRQREETKDYSEVISMLERAGGPRLDFHGGFYSGRALFTRWQTIKLFAPSFEEIELKAIAEVKVIDSRNEKDIAGAVGASVLSGVALGLLSGGLGLIGAGAGLLAGGNKHNTTFLLVLRDGRQALVTSPQEVYNKMLGFTLPQA